MGDALLQKSQWTSIETDPEIYLLVQNAEIDTASAKLDIQIINESDYECCFMEDIFIETESDGIWYSLFHIYNSLEEAYLVPPGECMTWAIPFQKKNDIVLENKSKIVEKISLMPGHYRVVTVLNYNDMSIPVCAEFEVVMSDCSKPQEM